MVSQALEGGTANALDNCFIGGSGADTIAGGNGSANTITGNNAANLLASGNGNDSLRGEGGADTLSGGAGADTMAGGASSDRYVLDGLTDAVVENFNEGTDTVLIASSYTLGANVETLQLTGAAGLSGTGNSLSNRLAGNTGANLLASGVGNDTLVGGDGRGVLTGRPAPTGSCS